MTVLKNDKNLYNSLLSSYFDIYKTSFYSKDSKDLVENIKAMLYFNFTGIEINYKENLNILLNQLG